METKLLMKGKKRCSWIWLEAWTLRRWVFWVLVCCCFKNNKKWPYMNEICDNILKVQKRDKIIYWARQLRGHKEEEDFRRRYPFCVLFLLTPTGHLSLGISWAPQTQHFRLLIQTCFSASAFSFNKWHYYLPTFPNQNSRHMLNHDFFLSYCQVLSILFFSIDILHFFFGRFPPEYLSPAKVLSYISQDAIRNSSR